MQWRLRHRYASPTPSYVIYCQTWLDRVALGRFTFPSGHYHPAMNRQIMTQHPGPVYSYATLNATPYRSIREGNIGLNLGIPQLDIIARFKPIRKATTCWEARDDKTLVQIGLLRHRWGMGYIRDIPRFVLCRLHMFPIWTNWLHWTNHYATCCPRNKQLIWR